MRIRSGSKTKIEAETQAHIFGVADERSLGIFQCGVYLIDRENGPAAIYKYLRFCWQLDPSLLICFAKGVVYGDTHSQ